MTPLQGYVTYNESPPQSTPETTATIGTIAGIVTDAIEHGLEETPTTIGIVGGSVTSAFCILQIAHKITGGEDAVEATVTSVASTATGVYLGIRIGATLGTIIEPGLGTIAGGILGGVIAYAADSLYTYMYEGAETAIDDAIDTINSTTFSINADGVVDIVSSAASGNLMPLFQGLQQGDISLGSITVYTHITDAQAVTALGDTLSSIATGRVNVYSPVGNYIGGTNGADSLTGSSLNDTVNGRGGDDVLSGAGHLTGGSGSDTYICSGGTTITDSDGLGRVKLGGYVLSGGYATGTNLYSDAAGNQYAWSGSGNLVINSNTTVTDNVIYGCFDEWRMAA